MKRLPCGHPAACAVYNDERGTFCAWCDEVQGLVDQNQLLLRKIEELKVSTFRVPIAGKLVDGRVEWRGAENGNNDI